ncbi:hypothetical protein FQN57_003268 [Myotisia sp. PD_48]|nr:hypothetical protein FQN57_003268 [Myotisia sp. PD_48]
MFSAQSSISYAAPTTRSRRRQRVVSEEGLQPPRAKRQRSTKLSNTFDTSIPDASTHDRPHLSVLEAGLENVSLSSNEHDLPVRGRAEPDRSPFNKHLTLLMNNGLYDVRRISTIPENIIQHPAPFRSFISPEHGYCLVLTRTDLYTWAFGSVSSSLSTSEVLTFTIPEPSIRPDDPLPLGTFVSNASANDVGMLIVIPATGRVFYWQTIINSAPLGLIKQKGNAICGSIPGMMSGEVAIDIINAEPSGFIITLSTGRVAHATIMDGHGKPTLNLRFLDLNSRTSGGGIFGGIKSMLTGSAWRRNIVAAKGSVSTQRGQRDVIIATNSGSIEFWDIHWSNGGTLKTRIDVTQPILQALQQRLLLPETDNQVPIQFIDFSVQFPGKSPPIALDKENDVSLWLLFSITQQNTSYFVVNLGFQDDEPVVGRLFKLNDQHSDSTQAAEWSPRIHVPPPGKIAFVVFKDSVTIISLETPEIFPTDPVPSFQDQVRFKTGNDYSVIGCGLSDAYEDNRISHCFLIGRKSGLIRVSADSQLIAFGNADDNGDETKSESRISTQSRLEQIVFFQSIKDNPIDFYHYDELRSNSKVEEALLAISDEILRSKSRYISTTNPVLEHQMKQRTIALETLATYVNTHQAELTYLARWQLLWNAEKMAVNMAIWKVYNSLKKDYHNKGVYLEQLFEEMKEKFKHSSNEGHLSNDDYMRNWFTYYTWQVEHIIPWITNGIRLTSHKTPPLGADFIDKVWQASEISLAALETAFQFRQVNAGTYGLTNAASKLVPQYADLPQPWTSSDLIYDETENLLDTELNASVQWMRQQKIKGGSSNLKGQDLDLGRVKNNIPRQFGVFREICLERMRWCADNHDSGLRKSGKSIEKAQIKRSQTQLYKMAAIGLLEEAITLAESFNDMIALVELMAELQDKIYQAHPQKPSEKLSEGRKEALNEWASRISTYFDRYGEIWADAFFTKQIAAGQLATLLTMREYRASITKFLRKQPAYAKIGWVNEIMGERNYENASKILTDIATHHETNVWCKRVELSLAKLSSLASVGTQIPADSDLSRYDDETELISIQESLYENLPDLKQALDESAQLQLASDRFANKIVRSKPALCETLKRGLAKVVARCPAGLDELADILTLMDPIPIPEADDHEIAGHEFSQALRALSLGGFGLQDHAYRDNLEKIVWRRCMIRDNWEEITLSTGNTDEEVEFALQSTALFRTLVDFSNGHLIDSNVQHLHSPASLLDAITFPHKLASRLLPEQRGQLSVELEEENRLLGHYIEKGNLDHWFSWIVDRTTVRLEDDGLSAVTRSHKLNDRDHSGATEATAGSPEHLPRYFAKSGHVDADPKKTKKDGGGKGNWGRDGDEVQDYGYTFTNARRRSNSSTNGLADFKTKFETREQEPVFEEPVDDTSVDDKTDVTDSTSNDDGSEADAKAKTRKV